MQTAQPQQPQSEPRTQSDKLLELGGMATLFHTPGNDAYADIRVNNRVETCPIRSRTFKDWLLVAYDEAYNGAPSNNAMQEALSTLEARARLRCEEQEVYLRLGAYDGALYLDMCDKARQVIEVTTTGWRVMHVEEAPIRFRRTPEMLEQPLPTPKRGGSLDLLFKVLNVPDKDSQVLVKGFLLGLLHPTGPYPGLALYGEQGSAKSSAARYIRQVIDPTSALVTGEPRDGETIALQANANWVPVFDNVRTVREWLSDALCRLATGSAYNRRSHYENTDLTVVKSKRPFILTSIADAIQNGDLINRVLTVRLPVIPKNKRKSEYETDADFAEAHPYILGALLDAAVLALRDYQSVDLPELPRMADLAKWVTAAAPALGWDKLTFVQMYTGNETDAYEAAINSNPVAQAVIRFMEDKADWEGAPAHLYTFLSELVDNGYSKKPTGWPTQPQFMSSKLMEAAPALRARHGIDFRRAKSGDRSISLLKETSPEIVDARNEEDLGGLDGQDDQIPMFLLRERMENRERNIGKASSTSSTSSVDEDDGDYDGYTF